ncbi:NAD(P)H-dependent oxidoreductase [Paucibacter sediminis]|uniref:FMN dependent NADH:quinone oxidoreductase n=1 Tax=Paucibacter sediminis TaxID=3019553 RepID=A0AA95SPU1_9BURK|nr:NAD(P)H-dependent oxidoreductase [Paucibacter sp. S2-9]WIT12680.1 NAD(P)H-dependent oxidoreductase [Paucibacter sp. S2-9]
MNILQINSSARRVQDGQGSFSTRLATELVEGLQQAQPGASLQVRDLAQQAHPVLDEAALQALFTPAEQRSAAQAERVALDDGLIAQIQAADVVVLGVPMINFGVPSQLKNWIDAISRARVTFRYTENGPEGLLTGKKVYAVLTRGGLHRDRPSDTVVPYLRTVLGFLGMSDVEFIYAEGLGMGPEAEAQGLASARAQIQQLLQPQAAEPATV